MAEKATCLEQQSLASRWKAQLLDRRDRRRLGLTGESPGVVGSAGPLASLAVGFIGIAALNRGELVARAEAARVLAAQESGLDP